MAPMDWKLLTFNNRAGPRQFHQSSLFFFFGREMVNGARSRYFS